MNIFSIIFLVGCYPVLFLMYFLFRNLANKNGYCFGATISKELRDDDEIKAIDMEYRKKLKKYTQCLCIIGMIAISFAISYISVVKGATYTFSNWYSDNYYVRYC